MNQLTIRIGSDEDVELLATLNKQLIEDEQHDNNMTIKQLKNRMTEFIHTDYIAYIFEKNGQVAGYALVNHSKQPLYLRQFFICRHYRRTGYGTLAFTTLMELLEPKQIDIEVMYWNDAAHSFWKSLGFRERSTYMRFNE